MRDSASPHRLKRSGIVVATLAASLLAHALSGGRVAAQLATKKTAEAARPGAPAKPFRITLLGTGNPRPAPDRLGPSSLIEAAGLRILLDAGRGATIRLLQAGGRDLLSGVDFVLLTHLHSDHTVGLPDVWLTGWVSGRDRPLAVYGPPGTDGMIRHLQRAYEFDVENRGSVVERLPAAGAELEANEIDVDREGTAARVVFDRDGLKILAFEVDHGPDTPALGYRFEYDGRTAVFSGDCKPSPGLVVQAHGADVLVQEVVSPGLLRRNTFIQDPEAVERVIARHTTAEEAGRLFALARPRLAVYTHIVPSMATAADLVPPTRKEYTGRLAVGHDLMTITIGNKIVLGTAGRPAR
ncbi:MAG TPA: MBL fold metallo-hydrolase [Candidatus Polarisedimenticolia bacterium]|nr:MBL fold metallo-hydrolase [Candidatus Polarisedimenticolia bacterium]